MNTMAEQYSEKYVYLCSLMCKKAEDYTKEKVATNNKAVKRFVKLRKTIQIDLALSREVYDILLQSNDVYVRQSAATDCLSLNIHVKRAVKILKHISRSSDTMTAMGAKRALLMWQGKLDNSSPFPTFNETQ